MNKLIDLWYARAQEAGRDGKFEEAACIRQCADELLFKVADLFYRNPEEAA